MSRWPAAWVAPAWMVGSALMATVEAVSLRALDAGVTMGQVLLFRSGVQLLMVLMLALLPGWRLGGIVRTGRLRLQPIFEVFNLLNRTNFTEANNIFGTGAYPSSPLPTFGQFEKAAPPRQVQLAVKMMF